MSDAYDEQMRQSMKQLAEIAKTNSKKLSQINQTMEKDSTASTSGSTPTKISNPYANSKSCVYDREKGVQISLSEKMKATETSLEKPQQEEKMFEALNYKKKGTKTNYNKSISSFNKFAKLQKGVVPYDKLTLQFLEKYTIVKLFAEFAHYLFNNYEALVAPNYLSCFKMVLEKRFPNLSFFQRIQYDHKNKLIWYSKIYNELSNKGIDHNHQKGKDITQMKAPVGRKLLNDMIMDLLYENTPRSIYEGVQMAMMRSSVGRPCELALCTWNGLYFDTRQIQLQWKRSKIHKDTPMTLPADKELMALCPLHSLGRYVLTFHGQYQMIGQEDEKVRWMFPQLKDYDETYIADKMTRTIHRLAEKGTITGLTKDHTAYGIKAGAMTDMTYMDTTLKEQSIVNRYQWKAKNMRTKEDVAGSNHKFYVTENREIMQAGLVLGGILNTAQCPEAPTCDAFMTDQNKEKVEQLTTQLFAQSDNYTFYKNGINRLLAMCLLACQLMYLKTLELCHPEGQKNVIASIIIQTAHEIGIKKETLYDWGDKVRHRFKLALDRAHELDGIKGTLEKTTAALQNLHSSFSQVAEMNLKLESLTSILMEHATKSEAKISAMSSELASLKSLVQDLSTKSMNSMNFTASTTQCSSSSLSQVSEKPSSQVSEKPSTTKPQKCANKALTQGQKDIQDDVDFDRFHSGEPNLMDTATFAARVLIYDRKLDKHGIKPFTFELKYRQLKGRLNLVNKTIRSFLTDEEKKIAPGRAGLDNAHIYAMFSRAKVKMMEWIYSEQEKTMKNFTRPKDKLILQSETKVGTVGVKLENIRAFYNKQKKRAQEEQATKKSSKKRKR